MDNFHGSAAPLSQNGFAKTMDALRVDAPTLWALITVETSGFGFLPDRRPKVLFERHVFHRRTGGRFSVLHPDISAPAAGGYLGGAAEYLRLERAMRLDRQAALDSASWGLGQIMGYHALRLGYPSTQAMVDSFEAGEDEQLAGVQRFISANPPLEKAFKYKQWSRVAFFYNGAGYTRNGYDRNLEHYHDSYTLAGTPDIRLRQAQAWLTYLGYKPRGIDGIIGPGTRAALLAFQKAKGLPSKPELDDDTFAQLAAAANGG